MSPRRWRASGSEIPLLIGGATTSKVHTAHQDRPPARGARHLCAGRLAGGRRGLQSPERRTARRLSRLHQRGIRPRPRRARGQGVGAQVHADRRRARQPGAGSTGEAYAPPQARRCSIRLQRSRTPWMLRIEPIGDRVIAVIDGLPARRSGATTSTGRPSSTPGSWPATLPGTSSTTRSSARRRAELFVDAQDVS